MKKFLIHIDNLVQQSFKRMNQLIRYGQFILYLHVLVVIVALGNVLFLDANYAGYISYACLFLTMFFLYINKRITKHMTAITVSLDGLTTSLDPTKLMNPDLVVAQIKLFKDRVETPIFTIIFKVF